MESAFLSVMQKFEKAPESKVVFNADVAVVVKSKVPANESPLVQCLAGKRWWGDGEWYRNTHSRSWKDKSNKAMKTTMKKMYLQRIPQMYGQLLIPLPHVWCIYCMPRTMLC